MPSIKLRVAAGITVLLTTLLAAPPAAYADDPTPPTVPGVPTFSQVTEFSVTLTWAPSVDNIGIANYLVIRALPKGGTWSESTPGNVTTITIRNLTPNNNYTFTVVAVDPSGNSSAPTAPASVRTLRYTAGTFCAVGYQPISTGTGTYYSQVAMTNLTPGPWQEWTLGFTLAPEQRIDPAWGFQRNGDRYTITFVWLFSSGAGPLMPGATRSVAFSGTFTGPGNPPPTGFTINDHPCVVTGDSVPPGPPGNLTAINVTPGTVTLGWTAATPGTNPIRGYEVFAGPSRVPCVSLDPLSCTVSGLTPNAAYTFSVRAVDVIGVAGPMATIAVRTPPSIPPSPPANLTVSGVTSTSATLSWTASTPGSAPINDYWVYRLDATGETAIRVTDETTTTATLTGLTPGTVYRMLVRARDDLNVLSGPSPTVTFVTVAPPRTCTVGYSVSDWGNGSGFTGTVTIVNDATSAVNGWTLRFTFPAGQRVVQGWNATWAQPAGSADVTATNLGWNATIQPGASVSIGFSGGFSGSNPKPEAFTLNGNPCTVS
jgi:hypothetical protein